MVEGVFTGLTVVVGVAVVEEGGVEVTAVEVGVVDSKTCSDWDAGSDVFSVSIFGAASGVLVFSEVGDEDCTSDVVSDVEPQPEDITRIIVDMPIIRMFLIILIFLLLSALIGA
jgi:hypothetical protein